MAEDCGDQISVSDYFTARCGLVKNHEGNVHVCMTNALYPDVPIRITWPHQNQVLALLKED